MDHQLHMALQNVRTANAVYRQADAHRTEVIDLAKDLGCSNEDLRDILEISRSPEVTGLRYDG